MENKSHAFAAGLFVLVVTALVVGLGVWLTRDRGNYQSYELSSGEGVAGLQPQAAVRYKGVSVGRVTHIGFDSQASGNVLIRIAVSVDAPITPTTFAVLGYQGVTGLAYVLLDDAGEPYPAIAPGPSGLPRLPLRSSPFTQLFDQGPAILSRVQEATERINQVLSDDNQRLLRELLATALERIHYVEVAAQSDLTVRDERLRGRILAALSHDVRTPLTSIFGLAEAIARSPQLTDPGLRQTAHHFLPTGAAGWKWRTDQGAGARLGVMFILHTSPRTHPASNTAPMPRRC